MSAHQAAVNDVGFQRAAIIQILSPRIETTLMTPKRTICDKKRLCEASCRAQLSDHFGLAVDVCERKTLSSPTHVRKLCRTPSGMMERFRQNLVVDTGRRWFARIGRSPRVIAPSSEYGFITYPFLDDCLCLC